MYLKMIDSYTFGIIVVNGKKYHSDIIIYPNKVDDNWWREEGHLLIPRDLEKVVEAKPELLIVGTGKWGMMRVPPLTQQWIKSREILLRIELTQNACKIYNQVFQSQKTVAAFHLTC